MDNLIGKIVAAIIRQEGEKPDFPNPGNLRGAPWLAHPVVDRGYWKPPSRAAGVAGIYHVIALHIAKGESLAQIISSWAPPSDNNPTAQYITNVKTWTGIDNENAPLWDYLEVPAITKFV